VDVLRVISFNIGTERSPIPALLSLILRASSLSHEVPWIGVFDLLSFLLCNRAKNLRYAERYRRFLTAQ
jgi:hypothetical protein